MCDENQLQAKYANTGYGPQFVFLDIGLPGKIAVVEPNVAFWARWIMTLFRMPWLVH